jgi:hypothetical protein
LTFFEGYLTLDLDSADVFRGIGIFCRFFALKDFLSYRPFKKVWADRPTAVRFRQWWAPLLKKLTIISLLVTGLRKKVTIISLLVTVLRKKVRIISLLVNGI